MHMFLVGGAVRDELLGVKSKDLDFAVRLTQFDLVRCFGGKADPFTTMVELLERKGFEIFVKSPEFFTVRARFPKGDAKHKGVTADFVLCRKDGASSDSRRPDTVEIGTLRDDLARRDFTVNAMAKDQQGALIDPFGGARDLSEGILRCVGDAETRMREDGLRALRALRLSVTKNLEMDKDLRNVLRSDWLPDLLAATSKERQREELMKMFHADTEKSFELLSIFPGIRKVVLRDGLWLKPTMEK